MSDGFKPASSTDRHTTLGTALLLLTAVGGCGGGPTPSELASPHVEIAVRRPEKRLVYRDARLNLVKHVIPLENDVFMMAGDRRACTVLMSGVVVDCFDWPVELWDLDVLTDATGAPTTVVGSGGWGKPSVAVLDSRGILKWRFDGGFDYMDKPLVAESERGAVVLTGNRTFDVSSGTPVKSELCYCGAVGSADFDRDGRRDLLQFRQGELRVVNGDGHELYRQAVGIDHWERPLIAGRSTPFVVLSESEALTIYDRDLRPRRRFRTPGATPPLHAAAAAFLESEPDGSFVVLVKGRGGWHRTILYVYSSPGELIYKEILDDDYESVTPYTSDDRRLAFMIGGRGEVWSYRFVQ